MPSTNKKTSAANKPARSAKQKAATRKPVAANKARANGGSSKGSKSSGRKSKGTTVKEVVTTETMVAVAPASKPRASRSSGARRSAGRSTEEREESRKREERNRKARNKRKREERAASSGGTSSSNRGKSSSKRGKMKCPPKRRPSRFSQIAKQNGLSVLELEETMATKCGLTLTPRRRSGAEGVAGIDDLSGIDDLGDPRLENPLPSTMSLVTAGIAMGVGALSYGFTDLLDRYVATRAGATKDQTNPAYGSQAVARIQQAPDGMRIGVQAGVALLGTVGAYMTYANHPRVAAVMGGIAGGAGTHLLWQVIESKLLPLAIKVKTPNEASFANRVLPDFQDYMQAMDKVAGNTPMGTAPAPSPGLKGTGYRQLGLGNVPQTTAGYPRTQGSTNPTQVGVGCGCAGGGAAQAYLARMGNRGGWDGGWDGNSRDLSWDESMGVWMDGMLGTPATGPQLQAFLARRNTRAAMAQQRQGVGAPAGTPLGARGVSLYPYGRTAYDNAALAMPTQQPMAPVMQVTYDPSQPMAPVTQVTYDPSQAPGLVRQTSQPSGPVLFQDAAGQTWIQGDPSMPPVLTEVTDPDCNADYSTYVTNDAGQVIGAADPSQLAQAMAFQDAIRNGPVQDMGNDPNQTVNGRPPPPMNSPQRRARNGGQGRRAGSGRSRWISGVDDN